jgi:CRISPR-associated protein Csb2
MPTGACAPRVAKRAAVRAWSWRIVGGRPLPLARALRVGEAMREMLMDAARLSRGSHELPRCLHGPTPDHSHARYLPEDRDGDGILDHLTVFASGGLDGVAIRLLAMSERLFVPGSGAHDLDPVAMGKEPPRALLGPARIWTSLTPYVAPWHGSSFQSHVRKELALNLLVSKEAAPHVTVEPLCQLDRARLAAFDLARTDEKPPPSPPLAAFLRVELPAPVTGPVILGYGSHFGLGQFECRNAVIPGR